MKDVLLEVIKNEKLSKNIYEMTFKGDVNVINYPDEFINIKLPDFYLRRPFSVADFTKDTLTIIYKVLGAGTKEMSEIKVGTKLQVLVGLGNGFRDLSLKPLIVAGGIGVAPFVKLVKEFNAKNIKPTMIYGEQAKANFVYLDFFKENTNLYLTTDDGSLGFKGNAVAFLKENKLSFDKYYACGPTPMLRALKEYNANGYLSLEARMGCGFGACMGCSIKTTSGYKRVCKEGPVFLASEVIYE